MEKYSYAVGVTISNEPIGFVENDIGSPLYIKDVKDALMFNNIQEAYSLEDKIRNSIGKQKNSEVITYKFLVEDIGKGDLKYTLIGEV